MTVAARAAELRTPVEVASWLAAGLALRRIAPEHPDDDLVAAALAACAAELPALPPPGVIADLAALLAGGRPRTWPSAPAASLRTALRAYDDDVLARWTAAPRADDVLAAYAHASPGDRAAAVALVVGALCERSRFAGVAVSPAALRRAVARRAHDPAPGELARLADAYHRLARGARQCRTLVDERDVFAVDHLAVLRDLGGRMTAAHVAAAADAIARHLPRRLPPRRELRGAHETRLADDALYPAGGFASIAAGGATGSLEGLVASELLYMDEPAGAPAIDLFSLRYVEGELLYYTRDDSVFRRHRHLIALALDDDLDAARVKDRGAPWQRLVLALGLVIAAIRALVDQLGDRSLTVHLAFPPALAEERAIVALLLEAETARGTVGVIEQPARDALAVAARAAGTAIADAVVISRGAPPEVPRGLRALHVCLANAAPSVHDVARPAALLGAREPWPAWCDAAEDVLRWLV